MASKQQALNAQGQKYIAGLANTARLLWQKACEAEGIPADSTFVVFSEENRAARLHDAAMRQLFEARQAYAAGGYVGLQISNGRAA